MEQLARSLVGPVCGICGFLFLCWVLSHLWRRLGYSGGPVCPENVERNNDSVDCKHKVFLCHSGEQKDFVEWMYDEIRSHDRSAFLDKNRGCLPLGCDFPREIFKAIEECEVGVVVLSKAFFTKTWWPMVEFARLAKRKEENKEFVIVLVLYDMELAECRNVKKQREWKKQWNKWARSDKRIVIEDWTSVFKLFGPILSILRDKEGGAKQVIREVVAEVCKRVLPETRGDDVDMQGRERICKLVCAKRQASEESCGGGPCVVGLYGVGGIGKSTVCKALCEELRPEFGGKVCYAELATNSDDRQEKEMLGEMVKRLIGTPHEVVGGYNRTERLNLLMDKLRNERVFLAIDNVGDGVSTKELARALLKARYAKDSFVVVTARTMEMLQDVGINEGECHEMPELEYKEAISLFLSKAPRGLDPEDAFTNECVKMCYFSKGEGKKYHYHPLALKVLGGQLGYDQEEWMPRLKGRDPFNASREKEHPIFSILRSSFDSLESEDQLLLMDVALFFPERNFGLELALKPVNIMTWLRMIHGRSEVYVMSRLRALKRKSLIECVGNGTNVVGMHDLWREFCSTEITTGDVRDRFWFYRVDEMHASFEERRFCSGGWESLQRVCLTLSDYTCISSMSVARLNLQHCSNLIVLKLVSVEVENRVVDVSPLLQLKSLEVESMFMVAPVDIQGLGVLRDLCVLIWLGIPENPVSIDEIAGLVHLEVLVLTTCKHGIMRLPDLRDLRYLRSVTLRLGRLPSHLGWSSMANLQYLSLRSNTGMHSCDGLEDLVSLVELDLDGCSDLETFSFLGKLKKLEKLNVSKCRISTVPGLDCLVALQELTANGCTRLKRLPDLQMLSNLKVLDLRECLVEPILGLENMTSLQQLCVHYDTVKHYPSQPQLTKMQVMEIDSWGKHGLPCMVSWIGLGMLKISICQGVRKLEGLESLSSLRELRIVQCGFWDLSIVSCLTSLQCLWIKECKELEKVPSVDRLLKLQDLRLSALGSATWEGCGTLPQLRDLNVWGMSIYCLPNLSNFPQLRLLDLSNCCSITSVTNVEPLVMLEVLHIVDCSRLESLPSFKGCTQLWNVCISGCHSLKSMPDFSDSKLLVCSINDKH